MDGLPRRQLNDLEIIFSSQFIENGVKISRMKRPTYPARTQSKRVVSPILQSYSSDENHM